MLLPIGSCVRARAPFGKEVTDETCVSPIFMDGGFICRSFDALYCLPRTNSGEVNAAELQRFGR